MIENQATGAVASPFDIRTFTYKGLDKAGQNLYEVGESWEFLEFIDNQFFVGICTSEAVAMRAHKHFGIKFSADFQYLIQKKFIDGNWGEGSSGFSACKGGHKYGFLPQSEWTHTTEEDRKLPYHKYIKKLQAIPDSEIMRLLNISKKYKIAAYAKVKSNTPEALASAIHETGSVISRFVIGSEWYSVNMNKDREQALSFPKYPTSGHLVNITKRVGDSYRIANSFGKQWARGGTAYGLFSQYRPTEMWQVWFADVPKEITDQIEQKDKISGILKEILQRLIVLLKAQQSLMLLSRR